MLDRHQEALRIIKTPIDPRGLSAVDLLNRDQAITLLNRIEAGLVQEEYLWTPSGGGGTPGSGR